MADRLLRFDLGSAVPDLSAPLPEKVTEGTPTHRTWNLEDDGAGLYSGVWESSPGEWRIAYTEWEFCHIVSGISVISQDGGDAVTLKAGDSFIIRPGFTGRWKVVETTVKHYVVKL